MIGKVPWDVFMDATSFNQVLSPWDISSVTDMAWMFLGATFFNQDLSSWNVSRVTNINGMLYNATFINQDLSSGDVSSVADMSRMPDPIIKIGVKCEILQNRDHLAKEGIFDGTACPTTAIDWSCYFKVQEP